MRRPLCAHTLSVIMAAGLLCGCLASPATAGDVEPGMAPGEPAAPNVQALLPQLLRTDHGQPYPMAVLKFGPEFWAALQADAGDRDQGNLLHNLFGDGLLFGIGPLANVMRASQQSKARVERPAVRWSAPDTMRAVLHLELDQPDVDITIEGQRVQLFKQNVAPADPDNLLAQLEFVHFRPRLGGNALPVLAALARSMTLVVNGLAPGSVQTFRWDFAPPQQPSPQGRRPLVVQGTDQDRHRDRTRRRWEEALAARGGGAGVAAAMAPGGMGGPPVNVAVPPAAPGTRTEEQATPSEVLPFRDATPYFPIARAASNVGADLLRTQVIVQEPQAAVEVYAGVDQVSNTDANVTVAYWTGPFGRQDVELLDEDGELIDRVKSGPAPTTGQALASWGPTDAEKKDGPKPYAFLVRNSIATPYGSQISETIVPLLGEERADEPAGVVAPGTPTVADLSVTDMSVAGELLQVRARVAREKTAQGRAAPDLTIVITDEAGNVVKTLSPTPPPPGKDYIFVWDSTDQEGRRVPDGRYVLRLVTRTDDTARGAARSELRYWIDVPLHKMQRRLSILGPTPVENMPVQILDQRPGLLTLLYEARSDGRVTAFVVDREGRVVRHLADDDVTKGPGKKILWDGTGDNGQPLPDASYTVHFELDGGDAGGWWGALTLEELPAPAATPTP